MVYASTPSSSLPPKLELAQPISWAWGGGSATEVTDAARFPNWIAKEGEGPPAATAGCAVNGPGGSKQGLEAIDNLALFWAACPSRGCLQLLGGCLRLSGAEGARWVVDSKMGWEEPLMDEEGRRGPGVPTLPSLATILLLPLPLLLLLLPLQLVLLILLLLLLLLLLRMLPPLLLLLLLSLLLFFFLTR